MAWPSSRLTTYIANGLPRIKAADLNALQDAMIGLLTQKLYTFKALQSDGTGGLTVTASNGQVVASASVIAGLDFIGGGKLTLAGTIGSATQGASAMNPGQQFKDSMLVGMARVHVAGGACSLIWGVNIATVVYNGLGDTTITLSHGPTNFLIPVMSQAGAVAAGRIGQTITGTTQVEVFTSDSAGSQIDTDYTVLFFGG